MNTRIQALAEQATSIVEMVGPQGYASSYANFDREKFAQLIVQECFDVVINDGRFHDAKGIIQAGKGVAMEHFGVER